MLGAGKPKGLNKKAKVKACLRHDIAEKWSLDDNQTLRPRGLLLTRKPLNHELLVVNK